MTTTIYNAESQPIHEVSDFVFTEADMGEASITCDIYVPADADPAFSLQWYVDYRGERFYLSTLQPPAVKDTSSAQYKYSLTFKSEREDLKRYDMLDLVKSNEEDLIPDKYSFAFQGDIVQFVDRFNANLQYNFGTRWEMRLADGVTSESVVVSCQDGVKLWNLLTQVYDLYGIRWYIAAEGNTMVIFTGYEPTEVEHIFEYDPDKDEAGVTGGLYSIERVNPLSDIYTRLRGTGGTKNLPYRYFKAQSQVSGEQQYPADPDYNAIIANNNYTNLMPKCFRDYLKGWNGTALTPETYAYQKGKADKLIGKFIPVDYAISDKESKWGVKYGGLAANEEIFPTIQGVWDANLGRLDEIVAVSEVATDNPEGEGSAERDVVIVCDDKTVSLGRRTPTSPSTDTFTLTENRDIKLMLSASWTDVNNVELGYDQGAAGNAVTVNAIDIVNTSSGVRYVMLKNPISNPRGEELAFGNVPAGTYRIEIDASASVTGVAPYAALTLSNIRSYEVVSGESEIPTDDRMFNIWIKDIGFDLREPQYWALDQGDMAVMFSDGWLAGEDYEFTIAAEKSDDTYTKIYIEEDTSKSIETTDEAGNPITVNSKWKISLIRSDAEFEASGKYLPNTVVNAKPGDHFFFVNIQLPQQYVEWAEERLQNYIEAELSKVDDEYPTFTIQPSAIFCDTFAEADKLRAGARIRIRNQRLIGDGYLVVYITSLTLTHSEGKYLPQWDVVVSETVSAGQTAISLLQGQVQKLSQDVYTSRNALAEAIAQMDRIFLRGDGLADTSYSPTTFARPVAMGGTVRSTDFQQAGFAGNGWGIYKDANGKYNLEIDNVSVRGEMNVNEITVNQIEFLTGKTIYSRGGIVVTKVEEVTDGYKLYFDTKNGDRMNPFVVYDQAYSQNFNSADSTVVKYYWRLVTEVGDDYIVVSDSYKNGTGVPMRGDNVAQFGNWKDATRQSAYVIDQTGGGQNVQYNRLGDTSAPGGAWSFQDRATVGFGFDTATGKAKFFCYGDAYIGNADLSKNQYMTLQKKEGDTEQKLYISGVVQFGAGSSGLTNLSEWAEKQEQIDNAAQDASDAKDAADSANTAASNAQKAAEDAKKAAQAAQDDLDKIQSDEYVSPVEKSDLKLRQADMQAEYPQIVSEAEKYGLTKVEGPFQTTPEYWEQGSANSQNIGYLWDDMKFESTKDIRTQMLLYAFAKAKFSVGTGFMVQAVCFGSDKRSISRTGAAQSITITDENTAFVSLIISKTSDADIVPEELADAALTVGAESSGGGTDPDAITDAANWEQGTIEGKEGQSYADDKYGTMSYMVRSKNLIDTPVGSAVSIRGPYQFRLTYYDADGLCTGLTDYWPMEGDVTHGHSIVAKDYPYMAIVVRKLNSAGTSTVDLTPSDIASSGFTLGDGSSGGGEVPPSADDIYPIEQPASDYLTDFESAYTAANNALTKYTASLPENIPVEADFGNIAKYYPARQIILDAIVDAIKGYVDDVNNKISDYEYLKLVFPGGVVDNNGVFLSQLMAVKNSTEADAAVVAGLYGGGVESLNNAGFKDPTHGILMMFSGSASIQSVASAKTRIYGDGSLFTSMLYADGGDIGGFTISADKLVSGNYDVGEEEMTLSKEKIRFRHKGTSGEVYIGVNNPVLPPSLGAISCLMSVENKNPASDNRIGILIEVDGNLEALLPDRVNAAVWAESGSFVGFRPRSTYVESGQTNLDYLDSVVYVNTSSGNAVLTLPTNPQPDQMYIIRKLFSNNSVSVGSSRHQIYTTGSNTPTSTASWTGRIAGIVQYNRTLDAWVLMLTYQA